MIEQVLDTRAIARFMSELGVSQNHRDIVVSSRDRQKAEGILRP
jgi:hypothetical protein